MKISLAWIFDYFEESVQGADVAKIVDLFNRKTAEIEHYNLYQLDFENLFVAVVERTHQDSIDLFCRELDESYGLPVRSDAQVGNCYFIKKSANKLSWASLADLGLEKDGLMTAVHLESADLAGGWRHQLEVQDYILDVDNKSINHRPDLWGHYGLAREISATMGYTLKPFFAGCATQSVVEVDTRSQKVDCARYSIEIQDLKKCSRFAGVLCDEVLYKASNPRMALRLMRLGIKAINAVVDLTNYVMLDLGHPMHAFDANAFEHGEVVVRSAQAGERLQLLDGSEIQLRTADLVIANHSQALSLAGIYGGLSSGYTAETRKLFLEAAGFDPTVIRKTAQHFKLRTEASTRFEKHLDPMQNVTALQRFLFLAQQQGVLGTLSESIVSVGKVIEPRVITLEHELIEARLGIEIAADFVKKSLVALGFQVAESDQKYTVTVPTYRMTKDIAIVEDIVEEVARLYGFDAIAHQLPVRSMAPFDLGVVQNTRKIKQFCAFNLQMHEVRDYLFYDESFLRELAPWSYDLHNTVVVQNSVSENWRALVTSLIPHLLKHVVNHQRDHDQVRFFEWNNVWIKNAEEIVESSSLSGVFYDAKNIDFYRAQAELMGLFNMLHLSVVWEKQSGLPVWYDASRSGELRVDGKKIGTVGMLNRAFCRALSSHDLFIFELDADFLAEYQRQVAEYQAWSKYQPVTQDISLFVPLSLTVHQVLQIIQGANELIQDPVLIDFYEQEQWLDRRSITVRYTISSKEKTLEKAEIDAVVDQVVQAVELYHAVVR
jgi:phenylalanyl-tRNA synthetase beta chain